MKKMLCMLLTLLLAGLPFAAPAENEYTVAASFYPVYVMLENITQGLDNVHAVSLTEPTTGCLHDYQLLPKDMTTLSRADVLVLNGAGMESFLMTVADNFPNLALVDSSEGIELIPEEDGETEFNAHIWLTPLNAAQMTRNIAKGLACLMPEHAHMLLENAEAYAKALEELHEELLEKLAPVRGGKLITFHEAFPYFAKEYGLEVLAVVVLEQEETISPRRLAELTKIVRENGAPPLFTEPQYASTAARALSLETGAPVFVLDPLVTGDAAMDSYLSGMCKNAEVLLTAFGVAPAAE